MSSDTWSVPKTLTTAVPLYKPKHNYNYTNSNVGVSFFDISRDEIERKMIETVLEAANVMLEINTSQSTNRNQMHDPKH